MRVAIDATPLIGIRTGIGVFLDGLLGSLKDLGEHEDNVEVAEYTLSISAQIRGRARGTWVPLPAAQAPAIWRLFNAPKIERFLGGIDLVHGTNYVVPASNVPRLVTVHDLSFLDNRFAKTGFGRRLHRSVKNAVQSGVTIHAISNFVAEEIRDKYSASDVRVVYPGVTQRPTPSSSTTPTIVAVGATQKRKGISDLVQAFEIVAHIDQEVELQIVGPPGDSEQEIHTSIQALPVKIRDRVHRVGFVDQPVRDQLIAGATILAHPSHYEGFGLPIVEAMATGVPVVTTTGGAIPEVVGQAAVTVTPGDVQQLAGALSELLENENSRSALIASGLERSQKFTWATTAREMSALYASLT
tara:strand:+ start:1944 stop:3014 length:1071 start_codon:yes stop_codon:yes gene_type:complete